MKVSVLIVTYNQEKYISQAIDSVLMQETSFPYEVVIGEDCSTDGTREIVRSYAQRFPDKIRPLLHEKNLGLRGTNNFVTTFQACKGEYIAILEGDDYWTSSAKLQTQVDLLNQHIAYSICFHNVHNLMPDGSEVDYIKRFDVAIMPSYKLEDIIIKNFIPTCSVMFRKNLLNHFPSEYFLIPTPDALLHVLLAQHGPAFYLDEIWGVRRVHEGGVISMKSPGTKLRSNIKCLEIINQYLQFRYDYIIAPIILDYQDKLLKEKAFEAHRTSNFTEVRHQFLYALHSKHHWLKDRAFWSISADAFLGKASSNSLRNMARAITLSLSKKQS